IASDGIDAATAVERLAAQSLLLEDDIADRPRFRMLETIREFALERLIEFGEDAMIRQRHADYFLLACNNTDQTLRGPEQRLWLDWLEVEQDNVRAALAWFVDHDQAEEALRLSLVLTQFWGYRGYHAEGRRHLLAAAALPGAERFPVLQAAVRGRAALL